MKTTRKWKKLLTRDANILSKYLVIQGIQKGPKYILPAWGGMNNQLWTWKNGETGIHFLYTELEKYSSYVTDFALKHSNFPRTYRRLSINICNNVTTEAEKLSKNINNNTTDKKLGGLFRAYCDQFIQLGQTILMTLEEIQDQVVNKIGDPKKVGILTTPSELSTEAQEEKDRLLLISVFEKKYRNIFQGNIKTIKHKLKSEPKLYAKITDHVEKYGWLPLNYEKDIWDLDFFLNLFKNYIQHPYNYKARIKELKNFSYNKNREKQRLLKLIDSKTKILINLTEATGFIRLYRANTFSLAYFKALPLFKEIANRVGIPLSVLKYYTPREVLSALFNKKKLSAKKGRNRVNSFAMLVLKRKYSQHEGKSALSVIKNETPIEEIVVGHEVKGMCAYPGKVTGRVALLFDAREMGKVKAGSILVCRETNPDLIIVMGKARAIVTDEGGLTSHAAIVSREMRKPCVIGTKIATKIFKDGDLVEVDANKGIVKKL